MKSFGQYFLKRVFFMFITLWLIATATFFLMNLLPGSPYVNQEKLTPEQIEILDKQAGLDKPLPVRYVKYMGDLMKGDFGV